MFLQCHRMVKLTKSNNFESRPNPLKISKMLLRLCIFLYFGKSESDSQLSKCVEIKVWCATKSVQNFRKYLEMKIIYPLEVSAKPYS